ncbi:hypothetical protein NHF46_20535 [Arthrobacter alpinus]|uniref:Uncharacterized protein n=1 Tax=Arthrobacter alpinus TaxID=656366 RepID=A0A0S2LWS1_9MICC|nr:hypothetical protein [Arthrobacter alpinus]ALO65752.1 hypothetical protein AS189_03660 [Arthrobacter alpinus]MDD0859463.1 hypothetical protein [Arthrobacter alpinus]
MKKRLTTFIAGTSIALFALTGCGQGSPSGATAENPAASGSAGLTKVVVGGIPIAPYIALLYGIDKGIFTK